MSAKDAREVVIETNTQLAPYSYAQLKAARDAGTLAATLASVPPMLLRAQAVRFLVERQAATGERWEWGDVDGLVERFVRAAAAEAPAQPKPRTAEERAEDRALVRLQQGAAVQAVGNGRYLVTSNSRASVVHRVQGGRCSCEARGYCWHLAAVALMEREEQEVAA